VSAGYTPVQIQARAQRLKRARALPTAQRTAVWAPYPGGPQERAYHSQADILGYGGEAGGGKSDLAIGLAGTRHYRAIIFRREFPRVRALIERSREIFNANGEAASRDNYNEQLHLWRLATGTQIEFASLQYEDNKFGYQGRPHDLYVFDEATEFSESQVRFVIGWNRSTHIDPTTNTPQRCRVVLTFNPPMNAAGEWVATFFLPWLASLYPDVYTHPNPAKPGDLRWYATIAGADIEVDDSALGWYIQVDGENVPTEHTEPYQDEGGAWHVPTRGTIHEDKVVLCKSRTFIPASLKDNPILEATGYGATIDAMPEPYRSLLKGGWGAGAVTDPWQLIPLSWVKLAEARHRTQVPGPLTDVGADIARGGKDRMSIAKLHGTWLAPLETHAGAVITNGPKAAALLLPYAQQGVPLAVDIIGIGSSAYDSLDAADLPELHGVNFGGGAPDHLRDRSKKLRFKNVRAAAYWLLREALDPDHGSALAVPDDAELREELCAAHFEVTPSGIQIEKKEQIKERIGRSPDKADALALAHYIRFLRRPSPPPKRPTTSQRG
jgi:hypothetical protein